MSEIERYNERDTTPQVFTTPARADTDGWISVIADVAKLADYISSTDFVPKGLRDNAPATAAAILAGREAGLAPMASLSQMHVIEGKPALSAEGMRGLVLAAGHELVVTETTGAICTMKARRRGQEAWTSVTWTIDMARAAGVANKQVWKSYPRAMLQARCTSELARLVFPDVIHGFRAVEELEDAEESSAEPAASGTKVQRKTRRTPGASKPVEKREPAPAPAELAGPPLPGEEPVPQASGEQRQYPVSAAPGQAGEEAPLVPSSSPAPPPDTPAEEEPPPVVEEPPAAEDDDGKPDTSGWAPTKAQTRMLFAMLGKLGITDEGDSTERHYLASRLLQREIGSFGDLTRGEVKTLLDTLARFSSGEELWAFVDTLDQPDTIEGDQS